MKFHEAMKLVEEGKKVSPKGGGCSEGFWVCVDDEGELAVRSEDYYQECFRINGEWEEYTEPVNENKNE